MVTQKEPTFRDYITEQIKQTTKFLVAIWFCWLAPSGAILLGVYAWRATAQKGWLVGVAPYLWLGCGVCTIFALITITLLVYFHYKDYKEGGGTEL